MIPEPQNNVAPPLPVVSVDAPPLVLSYATPARFHSGIRREGRYIVLPHGQDLPEDCIKCAAPADVRMPITFNLVTQMKQVRIVVGLCRGHARQRRLFAWLRSSLFGVPGIAMAVTMCADRFVYHSLSANDFAVVMVPAGILIAVAVTLLAVSDPPVSCGPSDAATIWIAGADEPFLRTLPIAQLGPAPLFSRVIS